MAHSRLFELPTEIIEIIADYLGPLDICALRSTCKQAKEKTSDAVEDAQTFHTMAQINFSICKTSLTGSELEQLRELAEDESVRGYIKEIHIEEHFGESIPLRQSSNTEYPFIWARDARGMITSTMQGIQELNIMLRTRRLRPEILTIRDHHGMQPRLPIGSDAVATLAKNAVEDAPLAIVSIDLHEVGEEGFLTHTTEIDIEFSAQHRGPEAQFAMLHDARLLLDVGPPNSYWTEQVFHHAPALKKLHLEPRFDYDIPLAEVCHSIVNIRPFLPSLSELRLHGVPVSEQTIASMLSNSLSTLTTLTLHWMRVLPQADWRGILSFLGSNCVALTAFDLGDIYGESTVNMIHFSDFCHESVPEEFRQNLKTVSKRRGPHPRGNKLVDVAYHGPRANEVLRVLSGFVAICNRR